MCKNKAVNCNHALWSGLMSFIKTFSSTQLFPHYSNNWESLLGHFFFKRSEVYFRFFYIYNKVRIFNLSYDYAYAPEKPSIYNGAPL